MRILLVEDDAMIGEAVKQALKDAAYAVDWVKDGESALLSVRTQPYGAILLDLGLPHKDGVAVLKQLRSNQNATPVLIVTARDALEDRVLGLDLGADDYLLKPFELQELLARLRAIVRRHHGAGDPIMSNGALWLNPVTKTVVCQHEGNEPIPLSSREFALLYALLLRPGAILSRDDLEERIYGWNEEVESNAVEYLIHIVRKKIGAEHIKNIRGMGWMVKAK